MQFVLFGFVWLSVLITSPVVECGCSDKSDPRSICIYQSEPIQEEIGKQMLRNRHRRQIEEPNYNEDYNDPDQQEKPQNRNFELNSEDENLSPAFANQDSAEFVDSPIENRNFPVFHYENVAANDGNFEGNGEEDDSSSESDQADQKYVAKDTDQLLDINNQLMSELDKNENKESDELGQSGQSDQFDQSDQTSPSNRFDQTDQVVGEGADESDSQNNGDAQSTNKKGKAPEINNQDQSNPAQSFPNQSKFKRNWNLLGFFVSNYLLGFGFIYGAYLVLNCYFKSKVQAESLAGTVQSGVPEASTNGQV